MAHNTTAAAIPPEPLRLRDMGTARAPVQMPVISAAIGARPASSAGRGNIARSAPRWLATLGSVGLSAALWAAPAMLLVQEDLRALAVALVANPLQDLPSTALMLAVALVYAVAAGFSIASGASQLAQAGPRYARFFLFLLVTPAILLSLVATLVSFLALFLVLAILCFPTLL